MDRTVGVLGADCARKRNGPAYFDDHLQVRSAPARLPVCLCGRARLDGQGQGRSGVQQLQPYPRLQKRNGALELRQVNQPVSQSAWERARGQPTGQEQCTHGCSRRQLNIPAVASAYESKGELAATAGQRRCPVGVLPSPWKKEDSIRGLCRYYCVPTRVYLDVHRGGFYFVMTLKSICIHI